MHDSRPTRTSHAAADSSVACAHEMDWFYTLLAEAQRCGASDLHLGTGTPPTVRVQGGLYTLSPTPLDQECTSAMCWSLLSPDQQQSFFAHGAYDLALTLADGARCRVHLFRRCGTTAAAIRLLADTLPLGLLETESWAHDVVALCRGLVLVTGATGSGKSTTLAALLHRINLERDVHIVTLEDPVEHIHQPQRALITQRELGGDAPGYAEALRHILRQDPDVVLIGEIRDRDTMAAALTVAETGHLVFSSLHTGSAVEAVQRVVDMFPPTDQGPIRAQLASTLEAVVCQELVARADGSGRIAAMEVLRATPAIRNLIREGKTHQLDSAMQLGHAQSGSRTMAQTLADLQARGVIASLRTR